LAEVSEYYEFLSFFEHCYSLIKRISFESTSVTYKGIMSFVLQEE